MPAAFVTAVFAPPANVPPAPEVGPVNVTVTPGTGVPAASLTVATRGLAKTVLLAALWPDPLVTVIELGPRIGEREAGRCGYSLRRGCDGIAPCNAVGREESRRGNAGCVCHHCIRAGECAAGTGSGCGKRDGHVGDRSASSIPNRRYQTAGEGGVDGSALT